MALEDSVAAFLSGRVMMIAATRDQNFNTRVGRGCGAYFDENVGDVVLLSSMSQWPEFFACAVKRASIAATFADPSSYRALQIKGQINDVGPATPEQNERALQYVEQMLPLMAGLGANRLQVSTVFAYDSLAAIRFWPVDLFVQTPGPGAGEPMQRGV